MQGMVIICLDRLKENALIGMVEVWNGSHTEQCVTMNASIETAPLEEFDNAQNGKKKNVQLLENK